MSTVMKWEDGVALQLDVTQWTVDRMGPREVCMQWTEGVPSLLAS